MGSRKPLDLFASSCMVLFCFVMSSQQIVLKAVAEDIAPVFQIALRNGIAVMLLILLIRAGGTHIRLAPENRLPAFWIGLFFSLEFLFLGEALRYTYASHTIVLLYTSPIFAAIGLQFKVPSERLSAVQWLGILVAFSGMAIAFLGGDQQLDSTILLGDLLALLAGASWGATTYVVRTTGLAILPAKEVLLYQLLFAFIVMTVWSVWSNQSDINFTLEVIGSLLFHGIGVAFLTFLLWFWLLTHYKASQLGIFSFLTPVIGVLLGYWWLDETIDINFMVGAVMIVLGVLLVSSYAWLHVRVKRVFTQV